MANSIAAEGWSFFKLNFKWLIAATLFVFLYMQGCFKRFEPQAPIVTHDTTVIIHKYEGEPYKPPTINVLPAKPTVINQPQYQPDTSSIQALRKQFNELVKKHTEQKIYDETLPVDTLGWVNLKDTVSENEIKKRKLSYNIKERLITTTITQPYDPKNQVFIGVTMESLLNQPSINSVGLNILFKNKRDVILGLGGFYSLPNKSPGLQASLYKKIHLKLFSP